MKKFILPIFIFEINTVFLLNLFLIKTQPDFLKFSIFYSTNKLHFKFIYSSMKIRFLLSFILFFCSKEIFSQTIIQKTDSGYTLLRNGKPYYVKGVGGQTNFDRMVAVGANSFRTWGSDDAQAVLAEAEKRNLSVMFGLWMQPERSGFDYDNADQVKKQFNFLKSVVDQFKDNPAILFYGIGNELDLDYSNTNVWNAVQDIAKYIHEVDPNHPTSTVTAGLDSLEVQLIKARCPDIDIYCVNTYGDIASVPKNIARFGWTGPYMITEWGPNGHWESPQTSWGVSIEQTSTEKKDSYLTRYKKYIEPNKNYCIGSYAFLWGAKQEYTETWYGLFSKNNLPTEPVDAIEEVFSGKTIENPSPSILTFSIDNMLAKENITIKADDKYTSSVNAVIGNDSSIKGIKYVWRIMEESTDKKSGGDAEKAADEISGLIKKGNSANQISFRAPGFPGKYRLFVSATYNDKVAYANIPFKVNKRAPEEKQAKFMKMKYTDMNSFKQ